MTTEPTPTEESDAATSLPPDKVTIDDAGTSKKKISVEVATERSDSKYNEHYSELSDKAQIPGFRVGRAPRRLIEKRYGSDVRLDVKRELISEAYSRVLEAENLKPVGEPELDPDKIQWAEDQPLRFEFELEVWPSFELPNLEGIQLKRPLLKVTEDRIGAAIDHFRRQRATLVPVEDRGANSDDQLTVDLEIRVDGQQDPIHRRDLEIPVDSTHLEGIHTPDLPKQLDGARSDQKIAFETTISEEHHNLEYRGKKANFEMTVHEVKALQLPEVDKAFVSGLGFDTEDAFRDMVKTNIEQRLEYEQISALRRQIQEYVLDNTSIDLPEGLASRWRDQTLMRQANELYSRGVPEQTILRRIEELKAASVEQAQRDLKLLFIMTKIAEQLEVNATDEELNGRIASIAAQYGRRPDRVRDDLKKRGQLESLKQQIQEDKVVSALLDKAAVTDVKPEELAETQEEAAPAKKTGKKTGKKAKSKTKGSSATKDDDLSDAT